MFIEPALPRLPEEDWLPLGDEDPPGCDGVPEGMEELEPLRPPEGEGMLGELRPELPEPPEELLGREEPEEPPGGDELGDEGIDDDCWLAQPPIRNADTALTAVTCAATTSTRFHR